MTTYRRRRAEVPWDEETARREQAPLQYAALMGRPVNFKKRPARYQYYGQYDYSLEGQDDFEEEYEVKPKKLEKPSYVEYEMADLEELGLTQGGSSLRNRDRDLRLHSRDPSRINRIDYPAYAEISREQRKAFEEMGLSALDQYLKIKHRSEDYGTSRGRQRMYNYGAARSLPPAATSRPQAVGLQQRPPEPQPKPMYEPQEPVRVLSVTPEVDEPEEEEAAFLQAEDPKKKKKRRRILCF